MDTRLSCIVWGIIGVIFGLMALLFPDPEMMLATFYVIFLVVDRTGYCSFPFPCHHFDQR